MKGSNKMLSIIVAKAKNNIIGKNNQLIWRLPAESKKFKELTDGKIVIMGRKTYETLGKFLRERKKVVFSNNPDFKIDSQDTEVVHSMLQIQQYIEDQEEHFYRRNATQKDCPFEAYNLYALPNPQRESLLYIFRLRPVPKALKSGKAV